MAVKGLVAAIVQFLTHQLEDGDITADSRESLEVAIQCLETAYSVQASDTPAKFNLYEVYKAAVENAKPDLGPEATPEAKAEAERYKNEGNALVKAEKLEEAINNYTKAIELNAHNAVYYCNRAAVYSKLGNHHQAIKDCHTALSIDPMYSKAYGRLGLAYSSLERHKEAKESYQKALEMEPDNESHRNNLQLAEEKLARQCVCNMGLGGTTGSDLSAMYNNPPLMNMIEQILSNPAMQDVINNLISRTNVEHRERRMEALIEAGLQLVQEMQSENLDLLMDTIRRQMGGNPNDPDPPQHN
ncbi:small glutamine-rich tetratricopeptide repeat-containing protein alpha-like isoform X1 [Vespa mandarinia]|uniref:small glutamine-rich tetratricopeptide repeat-containing protein alpha-like isoform X1 n=1 Tax=Vespa mandarinia TaxID=7446 RepID=UPI00162165A7|nr:small glutamine-rich tetratricopeptide repeat-containing protein alpha-like isoform X1 [Vespa mandarinia]XP_035721907.1 small glutamine-rich tetratricopeptide repeat-containing protein alpha-like isoform X1 [Vespa mandarinia]XP_035721908.1 small glutamine-rich tetratricopeptide repeat-containing protein alpha-like isoform X1 [Vespa mandarinia]XP_046828119.1 small glutamine-rich tetratricopeptide repeat-containing protein alpha isoform X1 [Vespa crabro]XP_046828120.1 small glutamine-rich tetr